MLFKILLPVAYLAITKAQNDHSLQMISRGNTFFTIGMYKELAKGRGNVFFSPISMHAVLTLLAQGADGKTVTELLWVLGVDRESSPDGYQSLIESLLNLKNVTLHIANKVYVRQNFRLKESFRYLATNNFLAEAETIDFTKNAEPQINKWCAEKTKNKIKDIIKPGDLDKMTVMIILNAVYFKGLWEVPFDKKQTQKRPFYVNEDETIEVNMMINENYFIWGFDAQLKSQILELKYKNSDVSMVIILPKDKFGIEAVEKKLGNFDLTSLTQGMDMGLVHVNLPKFKIYTDMILDDVLTKMGMGTSFTGEADFGGLLENAPHLRVSKTFQKAFIEVDEQGTEAAASSGAQESLRNMKPTISINHPFIMFIQAKVQQTKHILFFGKIMRPSTT